MLTHSPWAAVPGLRHGFLARADCDGVDGWEAVVAGAGAPLPISVPRQVHGTRVLTVAPDGGRPEADALATVAKGRLVGVVTADCVPVLLVERSQRVAAAVHAGWRGMSGGVLEAAVSHLVSEFGVEPRRIEAAIGPAVEACCYEVGPEVARAFRARSGRTTDGAWSERGGRDRVNLRVAARLLLAAVGVTAAATIGPCTSCGTGFCSYRRDGAGCGRQLSFVGWT
jgi:hypothetical protein